MKRARSVFAVAALTLSSVTGAGVAQAQECQPGIGPEYGQAQPAYDAIIGVLVPRLGPATTAMQGLTAGTYAAVLALAQDIANDLPGGRVVLTAQDGTVAVDTNAGALNTFANFQARAINENHNTRLAIGAAQEYPCSIGIERRLSTSTGNFETSVAVRLGDHLSSAGTIRFSRAS
jgi:hypothetical protein